MKSNPKEWETFVLRAYSQGSPDDKILDTIEETTHQLILAGVLRAGDVLPSSDLLAKHLGCSKYAVHNAYTALVKRGLLETSTRAGTWIASPSPSFRAQIGRVLRSGLRIGLNLNEIETDAMAELRRLKMRRPSRRKS